MPHTYTFWGFFNLYGASGQQIDPINQMEMKEEAQLPLVVKRQSSVTKKTHELSDESDDSEPERYVDAARC